MSKFILHPDSKHPDNARPDEILEKLPYSSIVVGSKRFFEALQSVVSKTDNEEIAGCLFSDSVINIFLKKKDANNEKKA